MENINVILSLTKFLNLQSHHLFSYKNDHNSKGNISILMFPSSLGRKKRLISIWVSLTQSKIFSRVIE